MLSSAQRMGRMIDDLLDLTRTRFGDPIPVTRAPMDLGPLCRQVTDELEGLCPDGALRFTAEGDLRGEWDGDRIAQVLSNLLRNAIQHGDAGGPITLRAVGRADDVLLTVHNDGPPIPPERLGEIFEPMTRHEREPSPTAGLGLGLFVALQVVLAHGGTLDVTSTAGGTTFTARLPRRAPPAPGP